MHHNRAVPAKQVSEIREILGVRASDNLQHAELILLVEGEEDKRALIPLLKQASPILAGALSQNALAIDSLRGGANLTYKLSQVREALCVTHCFLDHDRCGIDAEARAEKEGLITMVDVTFSTVFGMRESEIEDLYDETVYSAVLQNKWGVSTTSPHFKGNHKWSDRLRNTFKSYGKTWSDLIEAEVKADVAKNVETNASIAVNPHKRAAFDALAAALEAKLATIVNSKK